MFWAKEKPPKNTKTEKRREIKSTPD